MMKTGKPETICRLRHGDSWIPASTALSVILLSALGVGCGGETKTNSAKPGAATSGDEQGAPEASSAERSIDSDTGEVQTADSEEPSPWGTADSSKGKPLPKRHVMSSSAKSEYKDGLAAAARGDNEAAIRLLKQANSKDPKAHQVLYALGVVSDRLGQQSVARTYYEKALAVQPDYEKAAEGILAIELRRNAAASAVAFLAPIATEWERNLALQTVYADALIQTGDFEKADTVARGALKRNERYVPAMLVLVKSSLKRKRYELAESIVDQALGIEKDNAEAQYLRGLLHLHDDRLSAAMQAFQKAVKAEPDFAEARTELGLQALAGGNYDEAVRQFERVKELMPGDPAVFLNLGDAYRAIKQWDKAIAMFQKALSLNAKIPEAHFNLGLLYMAGLDSIPNTDVISALQKAVQEFSEYRSMMGPKLAKDDPSTAYLADLDRQITREKRRAERAAQRAAREAKQKEEEKQNPPEQSAEGGDAASSTDTKTDAAEGTQ